jgi:TolB-like protein/Flp pilus assembly protein TadD
MAENAKHPIKIDLNQFKLHVDLKNKIALTLHFNSPSRRFYLSLIAFVVNEMKKRGKIIPIPMEEHLDLLALLNESVGGSAGSSDKENLLPRIYRKWHLALPNLEEAPLFKVLGRKKEYDEGGGKSYPFTEAEKDNWANLFEYIGSEENVRLKFAIDKIGANLDDVVITYEDSLNGEAWEKFLSGLREKTDVKPEKEEMDEVPKEPVASVSPQRKEKIGELSRYRRVRLIAAIGVIVGGAVIAIWGLYIRSAPQPGVTPKEKIASIEHEKSSAIVPPSPEVPDTGKRMVEITPPKKEEPSKAEKVSKTVTAPPPKLEVASKEKMVFPLPDKPSIAVLPFVNMSSDPEQEFFSDGLTEEIITTLSHNPHLFVIARSSTFTYKGKPTRVNKVAEELGVRYVLEGSVRRAGEQIRINAQLIEATTGHHLWAEKYDGNMKDVFALQDRITEKIVSALAVKLKPGEKDVAAQKGTDNVAAYDAFLRGWVHYLRFTPEDSAKAAASLKKAIELDPNYNRAYAALAAVYYDGAALPSLLKGLGVSWHEARARAIQYLQKAPKDPMTHSVKSQMYLWRRQHQEAISEAERGLALDPNNPVISFNIGRALICAGRPKDAVDFFKGGMRLDPHNPFRYLAGLGMAHFYTGELQEAVALLEKASRLNPEEDFALPVWLAVHYALLGRDQEARASLEIAKKEKIDFPVGSAFNLRGFMNPTPFKDRAVAERWAEGLRKVGIPPANIPGGYFPAFKENQLTGEEIKNLLFGSKITGYIFYPQQFWMDYKKNGEITWQGPSTAGGTGSDVGKSRIEGDTICWQYQKRFWGVEYCGTLFRYPGGSYEGKNEYFWCTDFGFGTFSPEK